MEIFYLYKSFDKESLGGAVCNWIHIQMGCNIYKKADLSEQPFFIEKGILVTLQYHQK